MTKWQIFKMETNSIWAITRQKSCLQLYVCFDFNWYEVSLSLDRGKSGYMIRHVLRRKPKAKVSMLRLFREEHRHSLGFEKSFRLHCRESQLRLISKKKGGGRVLGSSPFSFRNLIDFEDSKALSTTPWTTKKMPTKNLRQIPYKFE